MSQKTPVEIYETLGEFYLGRPEDAEVDAPVLYDSKDLTTHAVILGMTGSGKTGLGVALLEEAALDGVPALVIDPKGDLANLALTFPDLAPEDFRPWIDPAEAAREGKTEDELAASKAELWKNGLAKWDQDGDRIRRLRAAAEVAIYTPGSDAGRPVSILSSFAAPGPEVLDDRDLLAERITTTVSGLLGLLGVDADPVRSPEHILLSTLLDHAWKEGRDLELASLIQQVQSPPVERIGVMPMDTFYPEKKRFELAMKLNALLAAPGFRSWLEGEPLDVEKLLYDDAGKPRLAVFSIAHLGDAERMFFVSLLLTQCLGWMRRRSGTSSLRALLYMDEVFGYLPPVEEPPSKKPLLTLLKQARAYGFGCALATQNPVDLDYKALSNIGTWFLGRLQTERDQARVMDGLQGTEAGLDRAELERLLAGLGKRVFLLHNVHEEAPELFRVRWVMSYLAGPLTRDQIRRLKPAETADEADDTQAGSPPPPPPPGSEDDTGTSSTRPVFAGVEERFLPLRRETDASVVYRPGALGAARVHFVDRKHDVEAEEEVLFWAGPGSGLDDDGSVDWHDAVLLELAEDDLEADPASDLPDDSGPRFAEPPGELGDARTPKRWENDFDDFLYRSRRWHLLECEALEMVSRPGESEGEFRERLRHHVREERDREVEAMRRRQQEKIEKENDRLQRARAKLDAQETQKQGQWSSVASTAVDIGLSIAGVGRKRLTANKVSRLFKAFGRVKKEGSDADLAAEEIREIEAKLEELEAEEQELAKKIAARLDAATRELGTYELKPRRTDVDVRLVAIGWAPWVGEEPSW